LATEQSPQRAYRAACPNCGAPVDFRSPASAFAVCSFCKSTIVRDGEALRRTGQAAELFDDHTPLQIGASGIYLGRPFTLVGRLQYRTEQGTWNEWHALFDAGADGVPRPAWLSEDNGRYVIALEAPLAEAPPPAESLVAGQRFTLAGQAWSVASVVQATLIAAQGELPAPPVTGRAFTIADLRNVRDEVATLDYGDPAAPRWSLGRPVAISELAMKGLAEASEKTLKARGVECPNCGTALEVKLDSTQSIVCHNCKAVVDVSAGVGGDLQHYVQTNAQDGGNPQLPLGSTGTLALGAGRPALPWQVVGYVERCEVSEDEQSVWREYLLYHRTEGFAFLVDSEDGWSWTAPITGVPELSGSGASHRGVSYRKLYDYTGKVTYVLGEFYWRLERDQLTFNTDYIGTGDFSNRRLNRERTGEGAAQEIVWSAGETLTADAVLRAFKLAPELGAALKRDALPSSGNASALLAKVFFWVFVLVVILMLFRCSDDDNCDQLRSSYGASSQEYQNCLANNRTRSSGGSFGGFSSGGGHK
jgi:ribosomal protein L37AE/L43A